MYNPFNLCKKAHWKTEKGEIQIEGCKKRNHSHNSYIHGVVDIDSNQGTKKRNHPNLSTYLLQAKEKVSKSIGANYAFSKVEGCNCIPCISLIFDRLNRDAQYTMLINNYII